MATIPSQPTKSKSVSLDDIIGQQQQIRDESTTVVKPAKKITPKPKKPAAKVKKDVAPKKVKAAPVVESAIRKPGRPAVGEVCRPVQLYLPVSLTERLALVAEELCGGNMSLYARKAFEKAVSESEAFIKKMK